MLIINYILPQQRAIYPKIKKQIDLFGIMLYINIRINEYEFYEQIT